MRAFVGSSRCTLGASFIQSSPVYLSRRLGSSSLRASKVHPPPQQDPLQPQPQQSIRNLAKQRTSLPQRKVSCWTTPQTFHMHQVLEPVLSELSALMRSSPPTTAASSPLATSVLTTSTSSTVAVSQKLQIVPVTLESSSTSKDGDEALANALRYAPAPLLITRFAAKNGGVEWVDVAAHPTSTLEDYRDAIATFLVDVGAHETLVEATLESVLLPQTTIVDDCRCLVVRCAVEDTSFDMDSIQELTNRLTILVFGTDRVVTVHRTHMAQIKALQKQWADEQGPDGAASSAASLSLYMVKEASRSFHRALAKSIVQFDSYEAKLFAPQKGRSSLAREIYHIKRRASVYSRILALTHDSFSTFLESLGVQANNVYVQDVVQDLAHVRSLSDELNDNANSVLQLLFQLSSYQLNELMRVLTMFSAFFIPLGFIASVYGMNFTELPGIEHPQGHLYCLCFMLFVGVSLVSWFKWKKFW